MTDGSSRAPTRRWTTLIPVILVPVALFVAMVTWAFASPVGGSPDDDYHLASIWCGQGVREGLCEPGDEGRELRVPEGLVNTTACYAFKPEQSGACGDPQDRSLVSTDRGNFANGGYPPVFYAAMSVFAGENQALSVLMMRVANALLYTSIITALFLLARRQRGPLAWGALATLVPLGMYIIPSVNPSSWAVISAGTLWFALLQYYRRPDLGGRIAFGALAVLATIMGSGARSDSAIYSVLAIVVVGILSVRPTRQFLLLSILPFALAVVSGLFFLSARPAVAGLEIPGPPMLPFEQLLQVNISKLVELWAGSFGTWGLGWFDITLPGGVWFFTLFVFCGLAFWGLRRTRWRKGIALALIVVAAIAAPLYVLMHDGVIVGQYVQPRYVYPILILFAGIVLLGLRSDSLGLNRVQALTVAAMLSLAHGFALFATFRRYVTGTDVIDGNLNHSAEWWWTMPLAPGSPFSPMAFFVIGTTAFCVAAFTFAIAVGRRSRRRQAVVVSPSSPLTSDGSVAARPV